MPSIELPNTYVPNNRLTYVGLNWFEVKDAIARHSMISPTEAIKSLKTCHEKHVSVCALLVANEVRGARSLTYGIWHDKFSRKASILFVPNNHLAYVLRPIAI